MSTLASAPSLLSLPFSHWSADLTVELAAAAALAVYGWGAARAGSRWPRRRALAFACGVATVVVALQSGIDAYDARLLSVHMVQHVLLLMVAPALLLLGQPAALALRALPRSRARGLARALSRGGMLMRPGAWLALFSAVVVATHLSVFYDATIRHPALHELGHLTYLLAGLALWWPLLGTDPHASRRLSGLGRVLYMLASMPAMALVGAYLNRAGSIVYAPYAAPAHELGASAVVDQQYAGAIMWVASGCLIAAVGIFAAMSAMAEEERRQRRAEDAPERAAATAPALARRLPGSPG